MRGLSMVSNQILQGYLAHFPVPHCPTPNYTLEFSKLWGGGKVRVQ